MGRAEDHSLADLVRAAGAPAGYDAVRARLRRGVPLERALAGPPAREAARRRWHADEQAVERAAARLIGRGLYPSRSRLAAESGRSDWAVQDALDRLRRRGRAGWVAGTAQARRYSDDLQALAEELAEDGLGAKRIARAINDRYGLAINFGTVQRWLGRRGEIDPAEVARRAAAIRQGGMP